MTFLPSISYAWLIAKDWGDQGLHGDGRLSSIVHFPKSIRGLVVWDIHCGR